MDKIKSCKAFFFGEQHNNIRDPEIKSALIQFLNRKYGYRHIFMEVGISAAWRFNTFLRTGDTTYLHNPDMVYTQRNYRSFWDKLYQYNKALPDTARIVIHGLDFERSEIFSVLHELSSGNVPHELSAVHDTIMAHLNDAPLTLFQLTEDNKMRFTKNESFIKTTAYVRAGMLRYPEALRTYFGKNHDIAMDILRNDAVLTTAPAPRNKPMFEKLKRAIESSAIDKFIVFVGKAHTDNTSSSSLPGRLKAKGLFDREAIMILEEHAYNIPFGNTVAMPKPARDTLLINGCKAMLIPSTNKKPSAHHIVVTDNTP